MFSQFKNERANSLTKYKIFANTNWKDLLSIDIKEMINSLDKDVQLVKEKINHIERQKENKIANIKTHFEEKFKSLQQIYSSNDLLKKRYIIEVYPKDRKITEFT